MSTAAALIVLVVVVPLLVVEFRDAYRASRMLQRRRGRWWER